MIINEKKQRIEIGLPWTHNPDLYDIVEELPKSKFPNDSYYSKYRYINKIFANLHPVDIIPVRPTFNLNEVNQEIKKLKQTENKDVNMIADMIIKFLMSKFVPDYKSARSIFNYYLKEAYNIIDKTKPDIHYVRIYTTDNVQIAESITSSYEMIEIGQTINNLLNQLSENKFLKYGSLATKAVQSFLTGKGLNEVIDSLLSSSYIFNEEAIKGNISISSLIDYMIQMKGLKIDFPKHWVNTDYNRVLNLNIELNSPYGSPKAIYKWVIAPLLTLLLLAAPANIYGTIGMPLYVSVKAYGLFEIPLGAIQSITIDRGGANTKFNIYKQPTKISVTLSIIDLFNMFSLDAYLSNKYNVSAIKQISNVKDIDQREAEKNISSQPTMSNLIKSFEPAKDSSYEPHSSYIISYTIDANLSYHNKSNDKSTFT